MLAPLTLTKASNVTINLAAYPEGGTTPITEGVTWSWNLLLSGQPSNRADPSSGNSSAVSFDASSCSTTETYQLKVVANYAGNSKIFLFNVSFTD